MKLETFFEKFDLFAGSTDAVERMRELVLHLAMRGNLVSQDEQDGSARELLEAIIEGGTKSAERRYRTTRADRQEDIEAPYPLPRNWTWTTLGTVAAWGSGSTPPRGNLELYGGQHTWLKSGELNDNQSLKGSSEQVTDAALDTGSFRRNQPGDVLFAMYGATVGKVAILAEPAVTNQAVCGCTPCTGVLNYFLFYYLVAERQNFREASEGGAQPNFSKDKILTYPFPLPPLAEQKRIVAKVDELMALCDRLEQQQQQREEQASKLARASLARFAEAPTPANLDFLFHKSYDITPADLRKSILTLAVQGKLTPNLETKRVVLGEVVELISGQHLLAHEHNEARKGIPYLTGPSDFGPKHPVPTRWTETPKVVAKPGDILLTVKGSGVGKTNKLVIEPTAISRQLMAVRATKADPDFIHLVLMHAADHFQESMTGIAIPGIGRKNVLELKVALPPLAEQKRIVAKVDELMALVDALETQLTTARTNVSALLNAVVHELTTGGANHAVEV